MPRGSKPLEEKPPKRDWSVSDEIWDIPRRVAQRARELGLDPRALAKRAGITQPTISKLMNYRTLKRFPLTTALALERALEAPGLITGHGSAIVRHGIAIEDQRGFRREAKKLSKPPGP